MESIQTHRGTDGGVISRCWSWLADLPLAWPLAKRDVMARYRGSLVGVLWALLAPMAMVAVYTLVFRGVFQARWGSGQADGFGYVARLFSGLMVFTAVSEVAVRATRLMQDNANLVKRVVFPLELLCVALLMQVAVHSLVQVGLLGILLMIFGEGPRWSWLWLPVAWAWVLALQYTLSLVLAAIGCYARDLQHMVPVAMTGLMFLSPVFYPADAAPAALRLVLSLNPVSAPIEMMRMAWFGDPFDLQMAGLQLVVLAVTLLAARWVFARLRPGFPDLV